MTIMRGLAYVVSLNIQKTLTFYPLHPLEVKNYLHNNTVINSVITSYIETVTWKKGPEYGEPFCIKLL